MIARTLTLGGLLLAAVSLCACTSVGEGSFSCPGRPAGVRCMSTVEAYRATEESEFVEPTSDQALGDDPALLDQGKHTRPRPRAASKRKSPSSAAASSTPPDASAVTSNPIFPSVDKPVPFRVPPRDMRVWIAPWQDASGVLHLGGYAIVELEGPRWIWSDSLKSIEPARFFPLQESASEARATVGKNQGASKESPGASERSKPSATALPKEGASR